MNQGAHAAAFEPDRRRRILFVQHAGVGGAAVSLSQIVAGLDRNRYQPVVLLLRRDAQAAALLQQSGARVVVDDRLAQFRHVVGGWNLREPLGLYLTGRSLLHLPRSPQRFRRLLAQVQPHLVYLNALPAFLYACPSAEAGVPVIMHVREVALAGLWGVRRGAYRRAIERCVSHTIYIGEYEKEQLAAGGPADVIYNSVDLALWNRQQGAGAERPEHHAEHAPTILFAGGLNRVKGLEVLLPALAILHQRGTAFRCVCLGIDSATRTRPWHQRLLLAARDELSFEQAQERVRQAGLSEHVLFQPFTPNPVSEFASADLVVFPALEPHFPRPLIEAGALGLPSVASDLPGPRAVVQHGTSGLLVPPRDPAALAGALQDLLRDAGCRQAMGAAAHRIVREKFNARVNQQRILDLIDRYASAAGAL